MGDVNRGNRPLPPFMPGQYYRFQLNSVTSILTRITGNGLVLGMLLIVWWLLAAATSEAHFRIADAVLTSWFGDIVLFLSLWALWYHTLAGVRHLIWDEARMLDIDNAQRLGWAVVIGSVVLTVLTVVVFWI
jgi:succinate dehydrogenase / fumarate reductase cytochrome b subunit